MCLSPSEVRQVEEFVRLLQGTQLNGDAPSTESIVAGSCEKTAGPVKTIPTKTQSSRYRELFKELHRRFPNLFKSRNQRNQAYKRTARADDDKKLSSTSVSMLKQIFSMSHD
jgi:hypothetical protein